MVNVVEDVQVESDIRSREMTLDAGPDKRQVYILTLGYLEKLADVL